MVSDQAGGEYPAQLQAQLKPNTYHWRVNGIPVKPGITSFKITASTSRNQFAFRYFTVNQPETEKPDAAAFGTTRIGNRIVQYRAVKGRALVEGDIDLGPVDALASPISGNTVGNSRNIKPRAGIAVSYNAYLWPKSGGIAQVPYSITSGNANIPTAIAQANTTLAGTIQWIPRTTETDYVDFNLDINDHSGSAFSSVGRVGGSQTIGGSIDASVGVLLHEMGHAIGLYHEQSRPDRDAYISLLSANIIKTLKPNFDVVLDNVQKTGLYDYASIMHYQAFTFTKNGEPTLETIPAGYSGE